MGALFRDFRDFIGKGSAIDLAVGLIVGSAIGAILKSFVDELIVPLTGLITRVDFSNMYFVLKGEVHDGTPLSTPSGRTNSPARMVYSNVSRPRVSTFITRPLRCRRLIDMRAAPISRTSARAICAETSARR